MTGQVLRNEIPVKANTFAINREWLMVFSISLFVFVLTSIPYVFAQLSAPPDKVFMGIMLDVPDHAQYFSWMRELSTANLAANKLTSEANAPIFFNLLWWLMGRTDRLLGVGFAGMLQILRLGAWALYCAALYLLIRWYFDKQLIQRITAFLIALLTSGFGWVLVILKYTVMDGVTPLPLDIYVAEGNTFLSLLGYPHFIAALFYIAVFLVFIRAEETKQFRYAVLAGLLALVLGWQHAYDLIIVYGVIGAYAALKWLRDRRFPTFLFWCAVIIAFISFWPAIYSVLLTSLDPLWGQVLAQFDNAGVFTPPLYRLPILLGLSFLLALYTVIRRNVNNYRDRSDKELFIAGWFLISFVLVYIPTDFQIHMLNGWQVPIAILATAGLFDYVKPVFVKRLSRMRGTSSDKLINLGLVGLFLLAIVPTNLYLFAWRFIDLSRHDYPYYLHRDEVAALNWIDQQTGGDEVVLSSEVVGQYVPAWAGTHVFLGHWAQTVDYYEKVDAVENFYSNNGNEEMRSRVIEDYGIDYVFYGPAERQIGGYSPAGLAELERVYQTESVEIYKVLQ